MLVGASTHPRALLTPLALPPALQDKGQVLSDVRSIIAEQLGTDLDKVRRGRLRVLPPQPLRRALVAGAAYFESPMGPERAAMEKRPAAGQGLRPQRASEAADLPGARSARHGWRSAAHLRQRPSCQARVQTLSESSRRTARSSLAGGEPAAQGCRTSRKPATAPPGAHTFVVSNPEASACINALPWCR